MQTHILFGFFNLAPITYNQKKSISTYSNKIKQQKNFCDNSTNRERESNANKKTNQTEKNKKLQQQSVEKKKNQRQIFRRDDCVNATRHTFQISKNSRKQTASETLKYILSKSIEVRVSLDYLLTWTQKPAQYFVDPFLFLKYQHRIENDIKIGIQGKKKLYVKES